MKNRSLKGAAQQYNVAYEAHYTTKNLYEALGIYEALIAAYPSSQEATYSRTQILNIVNGVVPNQDLLDAQLQLAQAYLRREEIDPKQVELAELRKQRQELDKQWARKKRKRREKELTRRVKERWRGPY